MSQADEYVKSGAQLDEGEETIFSDLEHPLGQLTAFQVAGVSPFVWKLDVKKPHDKTHGALDVTSPLGAAIGRIKYRHIRNGFIELTHFVPITEGNDSLDELSRIRLELMWERMPK